MKGKLFYRFAVWVGDRLQAEDTGRKGGMPGLLYRQQQRELAICERLYGKAKKTEQYQAWRIERIRKILLIAVSGFALTSLLFLHSLLTDRSVTSLARPTDTAEAKKYFLTAEWGNKPLGEIPVEIPSQQMPEDACELLMDRVCLELDTVILGKNSSLEKVCEDLELLEVYFDGLVTIAWESSNFELVDARGSVNNERLQEAQVITLTAHLRCQDRQRSYSFPIIVIPPQRDQARMLQLELERLLQEESSEEKMQEWFSLPDSFEGLPLHWSFQTEPYGLWVIFLTLIGCIGVYAASVQELKQEEEKLQQRLLQEYPGFLARLTMLAGTGMPIRVVFGRLAAEGPTDQSPVYEEVLRTWREMESGVMQKEAFENFGRRCRLPQYKKCAALLNQNLSKGSDGMLDALWQEAENACEERRQRARKKGEEAQTKMLFPMLLLLLVVMILVMVPACFSFAGM